MKLQTLRSLAPRKALLPAAMTGLACLFAAPNSQAEVKRLGHWPDSDTRISLDLERVPREQAIYKLAQAAGWSIVIHAPSADPVDIHVKDQPASKVLDLLLLDADYEATRDGTLVSVRRAAKAVSAELPPSAEPKADMPPSAPEPASSRSNSQGVEPPAMPAAPVPPAKPNALEVPAPPELPSIPVSPGSQGRDRDVMGESLRINKGEVVDDVSVMGGSLDVYGTVTGDINVTGGTVRIHQGAHVHGDVSAIGGDIRVENGGRIDGEIEVMGGSVRRGEKAIIGGTVHGTGASHSDTGTQADKEDDSKDPGASVQQVAKQIGRRDIAGEVGSAFARMALLFVLGTMLLALAPERMEGLKTELVARPMRSFAMGILGVLGGMAAFLLLCITVIGIPFALLGMLAVFLMVVGSMCAVLETVGRALTRHKTQNPYVHLAVGCGLLLGVSAIPVLGGLVVSVVVLLAAGVLVSTRGAGYLAKGASNGSPYRTASA